jgi:hypothetical protein
MYVGSVIKRNASAERGSAEISTAKEVEPVRNSTQGVTTARKTSGPTFLTGLATGLVG